MITEYRLAAFVTSHIVKFFIVRECLKFWDREAHACVITLANCGIQLANCLLRRCEAQPTVAVDAAPAIFAVAVLIRFSESAALPVSQRIALYETASINTPT